MRKLIDAPNPLQQNDKQSVVHVSKKHESATRQVQGSANYVDDVIEPQSTLYAAVGVSQCAKGTINSINLDAVRQSEGVVDVLRLTTCLAIKILDLCSKAIRYLLMAKSNSSVSLYLQCLPRR